MPDPDPVDGTAFRATMRRVPTPVVVVTARGDEEARGITIGSFTSVALDPPLVSFNVGHDASMHEIMAACDRFSVHVLGEGQAHLAKRFATPGLTGAEQFEAVSYTTDAHGTPILDGTTAVIHCAPHDRVAAGDHTLFIGLVVGLDERPDDGAVLYYQSSYRGVGSELPSTELSPVNAASSDASS